VPLSLSLRISHIWRRTIRRLGCLVLLACGLVLMQSTAANSRPSRIVVVGDEAYAPYEFRNSKDAAEGIAVDIWRLWSTKTGIPVEYRCMVWADALEAVKNGQADAVGNIFLTEERTKVFDFSSSYSEVTTHVFFDQRILGIKDLSSAHGFNVGVVEADASEEYVRKHHPEIDLVRYPSNDAMIQAAIKGEIRIFVSDTPIAMFLLMKQGRVDDFRHTVEPLYRSAVHAAVKRGNQELLAVINEGFNKISRQEVDAIASDWTGVPITSRIPWRILALSGGLVASVLIGILLWNASLRRRVVSATAELEASEKEARRSEERFRTVIEASKDAIIAVDASGRIALFNPAAQAMFGYPEEDAIGHAMDEFVPGLLAGHVVAEGETGSVLRSGHHVSIQEGVGLRKDGSSFTVEFSLSHILNGREIHLFSIIRDITLRKQLEFRLNQSQKLEVVGQLAGGVAHDVNNLLSPIMVYTDLMLMESEPGEANHRMLAQIRKAAESAKGITQQLLAFGRRQMLEMRVIDLNEVIQGFEKILKSTIRENILLRMELEPGLWHIKADWVQLQQVLMNLALNAQDAMPHGGTLVITTRNLPLSAEDIHNWRGIPLGSYVMLSVADSGVGMDETVLTSIFEPFFTTKEKGRGTGLGLSTVDGIIKQHHGAITASSESGKGSVFTILLPRTEEAPEPTPPVEDSVEEQRPLGRILIVEDNPMLLEMAGEILQKCGYDVICAPHAEKAIAIMEAHGEQIRLLLTDVIMPGMNGKELSDKLRLLKPELKVIYMSGYPEDIIALHGVMNSDICFIQKPFSMDTLLTKVQSVFPTQTDPTEP